MPRKMSGIAINMIDASMVARSTPIVVLDSATHLYPSPRVPRAGAAVRAASLVVAMSLPRSFLRVCQGCCSARLGERARTEMPLGITNAGHEENPDQAARQASPDEHR